MTHLRKMMLEELQRRNYAETTIDCYIRAVEAFSRHFHRSPDRLGPQHIRESFACFGPLRTSVPCRRTESPFPASFTTLFTILFRNNQLPSSYGHVSRSAAQPRHSSTPLLPTIEFP